MNFSNKVNFDLEAKVNRLEKLVATLYLVIITAIMIIIYALYNGGKIKKIEAESIVANSIQITGSHGKNSALISASEDGWVNLSFLDLNGQLKVALIMTPSGKPSLNFFGEKCNRISLGVVDSPTENSQEYSLYLLDKNHHVIWQPSITNP
jgi:hypothetical protein